MIAENLFESQIQMTESQIIHLYIRDGGRTQEVKIHSLLQGLKELGSMQNKEELRTSQRSQRSCLFNYVKTQKPKGHPFPEALHPQDLPLHTHL